MEFQALSYIFLLLLYTVAYSFYIFIQPYSATLIFNFINGVDLACVLDSIAISGAGLDYILNLIIISGAGLDFVLDFIIISSINLTIVACV